MISDFVNAIRSKRRVRITFFSKEDEAPLTRVCAPMDFGPSRRSKDQSDRFHVWDYESDKGPHVLSLAQDQVLRIEVLEDSFDPAEFIDWDTDWFTPRDWGPFS